MPGPDQELAGAVVFVDVIDPNAPDGLLKIGSYNGDPNGVINAEASSMLYDFATPGIWVNTDGATGWSNLLSGGGGASSLIIWRPGAVTDPLLGIYATFPEAHAAAAVLAARGATEVDIFVDISLAAAVIPSDTYDMQSIRLVGSYGAGLPAGLYTPVATTGDTVFTNWNIGIYRIALQHTGGSPLYTKPVGAVEALYVGSYCIFSTDGAPVFQVNDGTLGLRGDSAVVFANTGGSEPLGTTNPGLLSVQIGENSTVSDNTITGNGDVEVTYEGTFVGGVGDTQAALTGALTIQAASTPYFADNAADWNGGSPPGNLSAGIDRLAAWIAVNGGGPLP